MKLIESIAGDVGPFGSILMQVKEHLYNAIFCSQRVTTSVRDQVHVVEPLPYFAVVHCLNEEKKELLIENEALKKHLVAKEAECILALKGKDTSIELMSVKALLQSTRQAKQTLLQQHIQSEQEVELLRRDILQQQKELTDECLVLQR